MKAKLYSLWLDLVEKYWDYIVETTSWPEENDLNTFSNLKRKHCRSRRSIREDVAGLALNFRKRNRDLLWEYFYNTALKHKKLGKQELLKHTVFTSQRWIPMKRESPHWADMDPVIWKQKWCPLALRESLNEVDMPLADVLRHPHYPQYDLLRHRA